ncbi:MAG: polymer-forming cytoskeletal protein [Clostridiaceae bacterium]|nr:polymer-forming cytoskeletal protein [Clostridiaceae bacterium]
MSKDTFDDANVDKDLLNQIFADEGDDAETDALLDEMLKEAEAENAGKETEAVQEELDLSEITQEAEAAPETESEKTEAPAEETKEEELVMPVFEANTDDDSVKKEAMDQMNEERKKGTVTTITAGTTINGGISSDGSLEVMGTISGDIECQGKVAIVGKVSGNVIASEVYVSTNRLDGSLSSEGAVKIGVGTIVLGDVDATSAYIAGAVKGDIDVNGHVVVDSTAIIQGNIKAKSVQVNNGAVVDGYCSLNYAGVNLDDFFEQK